MNARWNKFFSYYKPYAGRFITVLIFALISAGAAVLFPLCVRAITGAALTGGEFGALIPTLIAVVAVEILSSAYYDYVGHSIGACMENDLRQELFSHLEGLSFSFYDTHRVGQLMSHLTSDINDLAELFHHGPEDYLIYSMRFIATSVIMFALDWRLTLCAYAFLPVMVILTLRLNRRVRRASHANLEAIGDINAHAEEALSGIRVSQAYDLQDYERRRFKDVGLRFIKSRRAIYGAESVEDKTLMLLNRAMYVTVLAVGLLRIRGGGMSVADLFAFLLYIDNLATPIQHLAWMTTQYQRGLAGFDRAYELLNTPSDILELAEPIEPTAINGDIEFCGITFGYRDDAPPVLKDVNFAIPAGGCFALVGVSGAGKSTLCGLIPRFYEPQQGYIALDGNDIRTLSLQTLRSNISIVQQDTYLFSGSVLDNIRYSRCDATDTMVYEAARLADADGFINALPHGYATDIGPRGVRLSGGQRQRLSIARAFLRNAPVLILDEATSALDNESQSAIQSTLIRLRQGRTTLIIAHRLSTIKDADTICVLKNGMICESGSYEELMRLNGEFARLYAAETE